MAWEWVNVIFFIIWWTIRAYILLSSNKIRYTLSVRFCVSLHAISPVSLVTGEKKTHYGICLGLKNTLWFLHIPCRCIVGEILFLNTMASIIDTLDSLHIQPQGRPIFLLLAYLCESSRAAEIWEMDYI